MQTITFQTEKRTDFDLLVSLTNRLGIKQIKKIDFELLNILNDNTIKIEIAILLFRHEKFSLGKASEFAGLHQFEFQKILAELKIPVHYDTDELQEDLENLKTF